MQSKGHGSEFLQLRNCEVWEKFDQEISKGKFNKYNRNKVKKYYQKSIPTSSRLYLELMKGYKVNETRVFEIGAVLVKHVILKYDLLIALDILEFMGLT